MVFSSLSSGTAVHFFFFFFALSSLGLAVRWPASAPILLWSAAVSASLRVSFMRGRSAAVRGRHVNRRPWMPSRSLAWTLMTLLS